MSVVYKLPVMSPPLHAREHDYQDNQVCVQTLRRGYESSMYMPVEGVMANSSITRSGSLVGSKGMINPKMLWMPVL